MIDKDVLEHYGKGERDFTNQKLAYANFTNADLQGCDFSNTSLFAARLNGADLSNAKILENQFDRSRFGGRRIWRGHDFSEASLTGADFRATNPDGGGKSI